MLHALDLRGRQEGWNLARSTAKLSAEPPAWMNRIGGS